MLALVALLGAGSPAKAAANVEILIIDAGSAELARKVRAEAAYAGFVTRTRSAGSERTQRARGAQAPASIRVDSLDRVELRVTTDDATVHTQELVRDPGEGDSFALRVVEQLRARLVDLGWQLPDASESTEASEPTDANEPTEAPPASVPPQPAGVLSDDATRAATPTVGVEASDAARPVMLWLDAGVAGSWARGGLGATPQARLGLRATFGAGWGASVTSLLPLLDNEVAAAEGEASVSWYLFGAGLEHALPLPGPWLASAGMGAGLLVLGVQGDGLESFDGRRDRLLAGAYFLELCVGRQLTSWLSLRASLLAGLNAPRPVVDFDGREVASFGRWFGTLGLALDVGVTLSPAGAP